MKMLALIAAGFSLLRLGVSARSHAPATTAAGPADADSALVKQYCAGCHSERGKAGGLSLASFDASAAVEHAPTVEKMIRKLRAGMMPPPGARRPEPAALQALAESLETRIDRAAAAKPAPGWRPFQRLNRVEYARAVKDLLALDVDTEALLPPDTISQSFDNVADVQAFSPTLIDGYLRAASRVAALAVGDPDAPAVEAHYRVPKTQSQLHRVDGAPLGTRGGLSVVHTFAADGDYVFRMDLHGNADGFLFGGPAAGEQIELSINGERKALLDIDRKMAEVTTSLTLRTPPIHVAAGPQRVTAAFIQRFEGPVNDLIAPIDHTLADTQIGVSDTVSRRKIFVCRPTSPDEERPCATRIVDALATGAFRRRPTEHERERLMTFFDDGRKGRNFEAGITAALEAILASPQFVFRLEPTVARLNSARPSAGKPASASVRQAGASAGDALAGSERIGETELATRLSFFLWASSPDGELLKI